MRKWIYTDLRAERSRVVAKLCAMAPGAPQKALSASDIYQERIVEAVKTTYPNLSAENYYVLLEEIKSKFPTNFVGNTESVFATVKRIADPFIEEKRRHYWDTHKASILPLIREAIPPAGREFGIYYTTHLLDQVFGNFHPETYFSGEIISEKLKALAAEMVPTTFTEIMTTDGQLRDEELVRLYKAGYVKCRGMLLERYATKLHNLAPRIISVKNLCPSLEYPPQFAKDVAQEVSLKLLQKAR